MYTEYTFIAQKNKAFEYSVKFWAFTIDLNVIKHASALHEGGLVPPSLMRLWFQEVAQHEVSCSAYIFDSTHFTPCPA